MESQEEWIKKIKKKYLPIQFICKKYKRICRVNYENNRLQYGCRIQDQRTNISCISTYKQ